MTARKYDPICSYPECGRAHNAKGLCNIHGAMQRRGEPLRPIQARSGPLPASALDRFVSRTELREGGCVVWTGGKTRGGYGVFASGTSHFSTTKEMAHRWSYENFVGPIPDGYDIDHLCRVRECVNPDHLEPVTRAENIRRAVALKTHCPHGHPYDEQNTRLDSYGHRSCKTCIRARDAARAGARNAKRRELRLARGHRAFGPVPRDTCRRGHAMNDENTYIAPKSGVRSCRECRQINHLNTKRAA